MGINPLDEACREHDTAYSLSKGDGSARLDADRLLAKRAWNRVGASDASWGEKAAALGVTGAIKRSLEEVSLPTHLPIPEV